MWMEPPATISAPEATDPRIVTSPSAKLTDWPERIGFSMISDGCDRGGAMAAAATASTSPFGGASDSCAAGSSRAGLPPTPMGGS